MGGAWLLNLKGRESGPGCSTYVGGDQSSPASQTHTVLCLLSMFTGTSQSKSKSKCCVFSYSSVFHPHVLTGQLTPSVCILFDPRRAHTSTVWLVRHVACLADTLAQRADHERLQATQNWLCLGARGGVDEVPTSGGSRTPPAGPPAVCARAARRPSTGSFLRMNWNFALTRSKFIDGHVVRPLSCAAALRG